MKTEKFCSICDSQGFKCTSCNREFFSCLAIRIGEELVKIIDDNSYIIICPFCGSKEIIKEV